MAFRRGREIIGEERAGKSPVASKLGIEAVENAYGEGDGFHGEGCSGEDRLNEGGRGSDQGSRWWDEVDEMNGRSW